MDAIVAFVIAAFSEKIRKAVGVCSY